MTVTLRDWHQNLLETLRVDEALQKDLERWKGTVTNLHRTPTHADKRTPDA